MTTATAERITLRSPGAFITITVESASLVPVGKYPEYAFVGTDEERRLVDLRVPQKSADRQLGRLEMTLADSVGKTLLFSRDPSDDPAKPFWGISLVSGAENGSGGPSNGGTARVAPKGASETGHASPPIPSPEKTEKTEGASGYKLYRQITDKVLADLVPAYRTAKLEPDAHTVAAICATLFIQASKH